LKEPQFQRETIDHHDNTDGHQYLEMNLVTALPNLINLSTKKKKPDYSFMLLKNSLELKAAYDNWT
jgi:hypothetical protein